MTHLRRTVSMVVADRRQRKSLSKQFRPAIFDNLKATR
jgi:hypothetical protein